MTIFYTIINLVVIYMCEKLPPVLEKELFDYLKLNHPQVADFTTCVSDDGLEVAFSGRLNNPMDSDSAVDCISNIERIIDASYKGVTTIKGTYTFTYVFNK